ncbi:uncharacterized protein LOC126381296 [Pectinophora gossypiella]|nr:uncharacterized protein LOC126381296 [Pectinophora gossypiella]
MTSTLPVLRRKRSSYRSKLTQFIAYLDVITTCEKPSSAQLSELNIRLTKVEEWYNEYDILQVEIEGCTEISDADCEKEYQYREKFDAEYFASVGRARDFASRFASPQPGRDNVSSAASVSGTVLATELQKRTKWQHNKGELLVGDMVLVKDDRLPPNRWLLGRVTCLHPGPDGISRVADVTTATGSIRRAYNRLCPLPAHEPSLEQDVPTPGACSRT